MSATGKEELFDESPRLEAEGPLLMNTNQNSEAEAPLPHDGHRGWQDGLVVEDTLHQHTDRKLGLDLDLGVQVGSTESALVLRFSTLYG